MAELKSVWIQVYDEDFEAIGDVFEIDPLPKNISALRKQIKKEKAPALDYCPPDELRVYCTLQDARNNVNKLEARSLVVHADLIAIAPEKPDTKANDGGNGISVDDLERLIRQVNFSLTVEVTTFSHRGLNVVTKSTESFSHVVAVCKNELGLSGENGIPRFYVQEKGKNTGEWLRLRNDDEWLAFMSSAKTQVKLYFVYIEESPVSSPKLIPTVGYGQAEFDDMKSEPGTHNSKLEARDGKKCMLCGSKKVAQAHILDKHRSDLFFGLEDIDDVRNLWYLCPTHHDLFDDYHFTLAPTSVTADCDSYIVVCGVETKEIDASIIPFIGKQVVFKSPSPMPHLFLLKQIGQYHVNCAICGKPFSTKTGGYRNHLNWHKSKNHITAQQKEEYETHLPLPKICTCEELIDDAKSFYFHIRDNHDDKLYQKP